MMPGMTEQPHEPVPPSTPPGAPPGFSQNGSTPMVQLLHELPGLLNQAVALALQPLPAIMYQAFRQALGEALQTTPLTIRNDPCVTCFTARITWSTVHADEIARVIAAYQAAAEAMAQKPPEDQVPVNELDFLPEHLHPGAEQGAPPIQDGVLMIGGTRYCTDHDPNAPGKPGAKPYLIANAGLTPSMLSALRSPTP